MNLSDRFTPFSIDQQTTLRLGGGLQSVSVFQCLGELALAQTISPIATHFCVAWSVVCLSVVRRIRASRLNRTMDLDAIWQVHLRGPIVLNEGP